MSKNPNDEPLADLRVKIDEIDQALVRLINERAQHLIEVGIIKQGSNIPIYAPHREAAVMAKVQKLNAGGMFPQEAIEAIYREMMSGSFKFAARLQEAHTGDNPVIIRIETSAGHGAGKPTSKTIEEIADEWAFLAKHLEMTTHE